MSAELMGDDCAPGCDYPIVSYHARRGGKELCGQRGKDEMMGAERYLAERWMWEAGDRNDDNPGANAEIMTADGNVHIAYVGQPFAEHIVELHNRTFGDGQDAPGKVDAGSLNAKRPYLPDDLRLSRRYGPGTAVVSDGAIREGVERLVYELVSRRVAEYMSASIRPMPITVSSPLPILANVLRANGYVVFGSAAEFEQGQSVVTHPTLGDTT